MTKDERARVAEEAALRAARRGTTEAEEQKALFRFAALESGKYPCLKLMFHIPNGGLRSKSEAARMKTEGVKPGVPDICLPTARGGFHALFIELKRKDGGRVSIEQKEWLNALAKEGYKAIVCHGWEEAAEAIKDYLKTEG